MINSKKKKKKTFVKLRSSLPISKHLQKIRECVFECTDDIFGQHTKVLERQHCMARGIWSLKLSKQTEI